MNNKLFECKNVEDIREAFTCEKVSVKEKNATQDLGVELDNLVNAIIKKDKNIVDKRSLEKYSDGELLAMFLKGTLQSSLMKLNDIDGFWKNIKY